MPYICIVSYSDIHLRVVQKCWSVYVIVYYFINCLYLDEHGSRSFGSGFRDRDRDRSNRYGPPRDRYEWNGDRLRRPYYLCYLVCTVYCYMWANLPLLVDTDHCEHKVIFTLLLLIIGVHPACHTINWPYQYITWAHPTQHRQWVNSPQPWTALHSGIVISPHHHHQCHTASGGCCVAPTAWPWQMVRLLSSTGELLESIWSINRAWGLPGRCFQLWSGAGFILGLWKKV